MSSRQLAMIAAVLAALFLVLNFTMDAGTLFLILAVVAGVVAAYLFTRTRA